MSAVLATAIPASVGPTLEVQPGLELPPTQDFLFTGALDVVEDDRSARRETVAQDGQCRITGQPMPGGERRRPVHEQKIDQITAATPRRVPQPQQRRRTTVRPARRGRARGAARG